MRVFVVVNRIEEIGYRQTTAMLIASLARKGFEVYVSNIENVSLFAEVKTKCLLNARCFNSAKSSHEVEDLAARSDNELTAFDIGPRDTIMIRTNPGRDLDRTAAHRAFLDYCMVCEMSGVRIINGPKHLELFARRLRSPCSRPSFGPQPSSATTHDRFWSSLPNLTATVF